MCILFQCISNPHDFVKSISGRMSLSSKELIVQKLLLCDKIKEVLSCAHMRSLEQRARNAHDQNEQTSRLIFPFCLVQFVTKNIMCVTLKLQKVLCRFVQSKCVHLCGKFCIFQI